MMVKMITELLQTVWALYVGWNRITAGYTEANENKVLSFSGTDLGGVLLGPGVLGDEVDTDAAPVHGGAAPGVVKWRGLTPGRGARPVTIATHRGPGHGAREVMGREVWRLGIISFRFRLRWDVKAAAVKTTPTQVGRRGSTIVKITPTVMMEQGQCWSYQSCCNDCQQFLEVLRGEARRRRERERHNCRILWSWTIVVLISIYNRFLAIILTMWT